MNYKNKGLTLIEVLIALAIVGIALTAVIKAASQSIRSTDYLQNKAIAVLVAKNLLSEARTNVLRLPDAPGKLNETSEVLGKAWYWTAYQERTPNKHIKKIMIDVYTQEARTSPIISLESYRYDEK